MSGDNLFWDDLVQRSLRGPVWAIVTILSIEERFLVFWDLWKKKQFLRTKVETTKRCHTKSRSRVVHHGDSVFPAVPQAKKAFASGLFKLQGLSSSRFGYLTRTSSRLSQQKIEKLIQPRHSRWQGCCCQCSRWWLPFGRQHAKPRRCFTFECYGTHQRTRFHCMLTVLKGVNPQMKID